MTVFRVHPPFVPGLFRVHGTARTLAVQGFAASVPGVPGVPGHRPRVHVNVHAPAAPHTSLTRAHGYTYPEQPLYPVHSSNGKGLSCSGYPEQTRNTRNRSHRNHRRIF